MKLNGGSGTVIYLSLFSYLSLDYSVNDWN